MNSFYGYWVNWKIIVPFLYWFIWVGGGGIVVVCLVGQLDFELVLWVCYYTWFPFRKYVNFLFVVGSICIKKSSQFYDVLIFFSVLFFWVFLILGLSFWAWYYFVVFSKYNIFELLCLLVVINNSIKGCLELRFISWSFLPVHLEIVWLLLTDCNLLFLLLYVLDLSYMSCHVEARPLRGSFFLFCFIQI